MRIGLHIPNFTWPGGPAALYDRLAAIARTADDAGFSFITVMDHFFQIGVQGPVEMEMLEGYSALSYLGFGKDPCVQQPYGILCPRKGPLETDSGAYGSGKGWLDPLIATL